MEEEAELVGIAGDRELPRLVDEMVDKFGKALNLFADELVAEGSWKAG